MAEPQGTASDPEQPAQMILVQEAAAAAATPVVKETSSDVARPVNNAYDRDFFHQVVHDAGRWAFGVVLVEVWVLNSTHTYLFRPDHGWWLDPYATDWGDNPKFDRLTDSSREDYLEATPLAPGCGLPGVLYAAQGGVPKQQRSNATKKMTSATSTWTEVKAIAEDPDQPYNPRLKFFSEAGLGWAAGIPFSIGSAEGLVVYIARATVNLQKLTDPINVDYLNHATILIGSAYALRAPRLKSEQARREERQKTIRRVLQKLKALRLLNKSLESFVHEEVNRPAASGHHDHHHDHLHDDAAIYTKQVGEVTAIASDSQTRCTATWKCMAQKAASTWKKCRGANVSPPPSFTWRQTLWTFFGTFVTLMFLTSMSKSLTEKYGPDYSIVLGPFGALMTLQFGLTAAPASQPRNAIVGHILALVIAHGIGQSTRLDPWFKQTLATSISIAVMVKCGVTHPPAGAAALLFSSGGKSWIQVGMMLVGNVVAIACATLFNNLSDQRKYPTFWGFKEPLDWAFGVHEKRKKRRRPTRDVKVRAGYR